MLNGYQQKRPALQADSPQSLSGNSELKTAWTGLRNPTQRDPIQRLSGAMVFGGTSRLAEGAYLFRDGNRS
jgi:hypothetical protein